MQNDHAIVIALAAAGFLTERQEWLERFMALSGLSAEDLKSRLDDPPLLAGLLAFVMSDDALAEPFCTEQSLTPQQLQYAQHILENL